MAQASAKIELTASPDDVWQLVGGFDWLNKWHPFIAKSELSEGGCVRKLTTLNGDVVVERLESFDHAARSFSYSFVDAPFAVTGYLAKVQVFKATSGNECHVEWKGEFTPAGMNEQEAVQLFTGIYEDGLKALAVRFGTKK